MPASWRVLVQPWKEWKMITLSGNERPSFFETASFLERGVSVVRRHPIRFKNALALLCLVGAEAGVEEGSCDVVVGVVDCLYAKVGVMK